MLLTVRDDFKFDPTVTLLHKNHSPTSSKLKGHTTAATQHDDNGRQEFKSVHAFSLLRIASKWLPFDLCTPGERLENLGASW